VVSWLPSPPGLVPYPDVARGLGGSSVSSSGVGEARPTFPGCGRVAWRGGDEGHGGVKEGWPIPSHKPHVRLLQWSRGVRKVLGFVPLESRAWLDSGDEARALLALRPFGLGLTRTHGPAALSLWGRRGFLGHIFFSCFLACPMYPGLIHSRPVLSKSHVGVGVQGSPAGPSVSARPLVPHSPAQCPGPCVSPWHSNAAAGLGSSSRSPARPWVLPSWAHSGANSPAWPWPWPTPIPREMPDAQGWGCPGASPAVCSWLGWWNMDRPWQRRPLEASWQWVCHFTCVLYLLK